MIYRIPLRGRGGEIVDLRRTLLSHGLASLPPMQVDPDGRRLEVTVRADRVVRTMRVRPAGSRAAVVEVVGRPLSQPTAQALVNRIRHILRLDEDLSQFYALVENDSDLAWAASGAGRLVRSGSVFEEIVKTICTTNCAWSGTVRMVSALVEHLGERAPGAPSGTWRGRAFPTPQAMWEAPEDFYREVVRAGYRGPYLRRFAELVLEGLDVEAWGAKSSEELPDEELSRLLQSLPGVGPYAAAHVMLMIGRYSSLILDSWTRPTYARLSNNRKASDAAISRRFRRYGRFAGLAFWLYLTRPWISDDSSKL